MIDNGVEERIDLEYKGSDSLKKSEGAKKEITKDISSFANSAGGLLIYGIAEFDAPDKAHLPERLDPIDRTAFTREWLDQVIGNIRPRLDVIITPIDFDTGQNDTAYVIEIPKGVTAHQASDCRYYKGFNFRCEMMLDHEIRDVMSRSEAPKLVPHFRIRIGTIVYSSPYPDVAIFGGGRKTSRKEPHPYFEVFIENQSACVANYAFLWINVPKGLLSDWPHNAESCERVFDDDDATTTIQICNRSRDVVGHHMVAMYSQPQYSDPYFFPVIPYHTAEIASFDLDGSVFKERKENGVIKWVVQTDKSLRESGEIRLKDLDVRNDHKKDKAER
jgi:Putative DNA-binding domain